MPDLRFIVESAEVVHYAAAPLLAFKLQIANNRREEIIHTVALRAQIQIEATRRKYDAAEQERLLDLFGEPDRWGQTLRTMLWTHASVVVPRFTGSVLADIPVPSTFDFNVAATKYFHGVTNRQRFNFGVVYPRTYSESQGGTDVCTMQTECLVLGNEETQCAVRVRFLRMVARSIARLPAPSSGPSSIAEGKIENVERLEVDGK